MTAILAALRLAAGFIAAHWQVFAIGAAVAALVGISYGRGVANSNAKHERRAAQAAAAAAQETQRLVEKNYAITLNVTEVLERERVVTQTIIRKVADVVPLNACPVDAGVRRVHDAAAAGEDPTARLAVDAAPVDARTLASTLAINYGRCREDQARLVGLQDYVCDVVQPDGIGDLCRARRAP
jgi:type II secretory pathway pseudopilin PulG